MNEIQKSILVESGMPRSADLDFLLGRKISFTLENEERKLLITDAREFGNEVIISFHSCTVFGSHGLLGLVIPEKGGLLLRTYFKSNNTDGKLTGSVTGIENFKLW